jgi:S-DNA-T family DNA segregation ATPase FtsK/SpoIIIE
MHQQELETQADRIELVLRDHKAPAIVTGGVVTPRWIQFLLQAAPGIKLNRIEALSREIAVALGVTNTRVTTDHGAVRVDVPRSDPQPVKLMNLSARIPKRRIPFGAATLGLTDDGAPLLIRLPSPDVGHVLIAGTTGSGKTALLHSIVVSLAQRHRRSELQLLLIDPKGYSFAELTSLPHLLHPIVTQPDRASLALSEMVAVMETRGRARAIEVDRALHVRERPGVTKPLIVIVIDELADLVQTGGPEVIKGVGRLVQRGREAGLHVIAATQKPSSSIIGPLITANFPVRLVGRVVSADDARVAAGIGGTRAEGLNGHGDFIAITAGEVIRFQAAYISPEEMLDAARGKG